jgi:hypothetical protein
VKKISMLLNPVFIEICAIPTIYKEFSLFLFLNILQIILFLSWLNAIKYEYKENFYVKITNNNEEL